MWVITSINNSTHEVTLLSPEGHEISTTVPAESRSPELKQAYINKFVARKARIIKTKSAIGYVVRHLGVLIAVAEAIYIFYK